MSYRDLLDVLSDWATILTAAVATIAYWHFVANQRTRQKALEDYLREVKLGRHYEDRHSVLHLMAVLKMSEAEVLQAGFRSRKVLSMPGQDERGRVDRIYFEYDDEDLPIQRPL